MENPAVQHNVASPSGHAWSTYGKSHRFIAAAGPITPDRSPNPSSWSFAFGPYRVSVAQRVLLRNGAKVKLGVRAFDLLAALASRPGQVISQRELIATVWKNTVVEESSLRVQMGHLRRAIGDGNSGVRYIATLSGRGYCFVAPVETGREEPALLTDHRHQAILSSNTWPLPGATLVGRDREVQAVLEQVGRTQHLTLIGPSGVGKSSLALEAARRVAPLFNAGYKVVDVGQASSWTGTAEIVRAEIGQLVPGSVAGPHQLLLILDNCDDYLEEVAALIREVCVTRMDIHFIVTACRALPGMGGASLAVPPLRYPTTTASLSAVAAMSFPAIQLFVQEVLPRFPMFTFDDADAVLMTQACAKLSGMPLAIKLAAAWVGHVPLSALLASIDIDLAHCCRGTCECRAST